MNGHERRKVWAHLEGSPFAIRRFVVRKPLTEGAAYGIERIERRKLRDRRITGAKPLQHA